MPNIKLTLKLFDKEHDLTVDNAHSLKDYASQIRKTIEELMEEQDKKIETNLIQFTCDNKPIDELKPLIEQGFDTDTVITVSVKAMGLESDLVTLQAGQSTEHIPTSELTEQPTTAPTQEIESTDQLTEHTSESLLMTELKPEPPLNFEKIELNTEAKKILENSGLKYFFAIRPDNLFKLVVDGRFHATQKGFVKYESREEGSVQKVLEAIAEGALFYIGQKESLTTEFIRKLHFTCTQVKKLKDQGTKGGQFRRATQELSEIFSFGLWWISIEGLKELNQFRDLLMSQTNRKAYTYVFKEYFCLDFALRNFTDRKPNDACVMHGLVHEVQECQTFFDYISTRYNQRKKEAKDDNELIEAMVDAAYNIEHLHGFNDANIRTTLICLNILLMSEGFPPVTYYDPNMIDGISKKEFCGVVKQGMLQTLDIIKNPDKIQFNFKHSDFTPDEKLKIENMTAPIMLLKEELGLKSLEAHEIKSMEERINALPKYPTPTFIYANEIAVENIEEIIAKAIIAEKEEECSLIKKVLNDIRIIEGDKEGKIFKTLDALEEKTPRTRLYFDYEEYGKNMEDICKESFAASQKTKKEDLLVTYQTGFAIYLSPEDIKKIEKHVQKTDETRTLSTLAWTHNFRIEPVEKTYSFSFKDTETAKKFMKKYDVWESSSKPGKWKRITAIEPNFLDRFFNKPPCIQVLFSKKDIEKINNKISAQKSISPEESKKAQFS